MIKRTPLESLNKNGDKPITKRFCKMRRGNPGRPPFPFIVVLWTERALEDIKKKKSSISLSLVGTNILLHSPKIHHKLKLTLPELELLPGTPFFVFSFKSHRIIAAYFSQKHSQNQLARLNVHPHPCRKTQATLLVRSHGHFDCMWQNPAPSLELLPDRALTRGPDQAGGETEEDSVARRVFDWVEGDAAKADADDHWWPLADWWHRRFSSRLLELAGHSSCVWTKI